MRESWETISPWPTSSWCDRRGRRVPPGPHRDGKRTPGRTLTMHHLGSDRGEDGNRRDPGGPGRRTGDAGTAHRLPGKGDHSDSPGPRDGDGGPRTGTAGAVPGPRNSQGRASQQHLLGQPGITANSNRRG